MLEVNIIDFKLGYVLSGSMDMPIKLSLDEVDLLQFTGLHDKNRKEIYESDILGDETCHLEVYFSDNGYLLRSVNGEGTSSLPVWALADSFNQIIGNIHQNPKLLQ